MLLQNDTFEKLRDEAIRRDPRSRQFADRFRRDAIEKSEQPMPSKKHDIWTAGRKVRDWIVDFFAPFQLREFAPASLGSVMGVKATNDTFIPEIGGYLRMEIEPCVGKDRLDARIWLEDNEGASPFENLSLIGVIEDIDGRIEREVSLTAGPRNLVSVEIDPQLERRFVFDLYEGDRLLLEALELSFRK